MANVTIPNLTSATTIAPSTDLMVLEQTAGTRKATLSQIFTSSATSGSGLGITSGGVYAIKSGLDSDISDINTLLGSTSIASIGDGTVTGAVSQINSDLTDIGEFTTLFIGGSTSEQWATNLTLLDNINNYKYLVLYIADDTLQVSTDNIFNPATIPVSLFKYATGGTGLAVTSDSRYASVRYISATTINARTNAPFKILGIK